MNKTFTKEFIRTNLDCYNKQSKVYLPVVDKRLDELNDTITLKEIFESDIRTEDKFWWLMVHTDISVIELQELGLRIAEVAERIYKAETGSNKLQEYLDKVNSGIDVTDELKGHIKEGSDPVSRAENALKAFTRAVTAQFTEGHKRPLVIKASQRLIFASFKHELYTSWVNEILTSYGI